MQMNPTAQHGIVRLRSLLAFGLCLSATFFGIAGLAATPDAAKLSSGRPTRLPSAMNANAPSGPGWSIVSSPTTYLLYGVTCSSASDCWVVGAEGGNTLLEHWDGTSWTIPSSGATPGELFGVTCNSQSDCFAVGVGIIEHWDGFSWSVMSSANVPNKSNVLSGVACASASDCWAVGQSYDDSSRHTLIENWNGTAWTIISSPTAPGTDFNVLSSVTCNSSSDCWAVGFQYHGDYPYSPPQTLIEHWDGNAWSIVTSPNTSNTYENYLNSVTCVSPSQCWAAGYFGGSGSMVASQTLVEVWDGNSWSIIPSPNINTARDSYLNILNGIACTSSTNCWAVGYSYAGGPYLILIEHWDGNSWSIFTSSQIGSGDVTYLKSVACPSESVCWSAGFYRPGLVMNGFIEEYSPTVPALTSVGSRMTHGSAGTFDISLPVTGSPGVECRSSNALGAGSYSVVFSFVNAVTNCGTAANAGASVVAGPNANQCTENLTGVSDGQYVNVELDNVVDAQNNTGSVSVPMGVLFGDVTGDGFVNVGDSVQVRNHAGEDVSLTNFRYDLNADGAINVGDTAIVRSHSGDFLP